jgi:hypothetical protein
MPGASVLRDRGERLKQTTHAGDIEPEDILLHLPSAVGRRAICNDTLRRYEWEHRLAQANDALNEIRDQLRLRSHLYNFKDRFARGQRENMKSRSTLNRVNEKIDFSATKYRVAHAALTQLAPLLNETGWEKALKPLLKDDIKGLGERGFDEIEVKRKMDKAEGRQKYSKMQGKPKPDKTEGKRKLSWIWLTPGVALDENGKEGDDRVHDSK